MKALRIVVGCLRREVHVGLRVILLQMGHRGVGVNRGFVPTHIACSCGRVFYDEGGAA